MARRIPDPPPRTRLSGPLALAHGRTSGGRTYSGMRCRRTARARALPPCTVASSLRAHAPPSPGLPWPVPLPRWLPRRGVPLPPPGDARSAFPPAMVPRPLAVTAAVWANAPPRSVPSRLDGWMAPPAVARRAAPLPVAWVAYSEPTVDLLDDYTSTPVATAAAAGAAVGMEGQPEQAAGANCSLDLPFMYGEEQDSEVPVGNRPWPDHEEGANEDGGWASTAVAEDVLDEAAFAIDDEVIGGDAAEEEPVDVKPVVHTPGVGSVESTLKRLHLVAAAEAANRYEKGPGRRAPPTPRPSEVEVALGDRRRSVAARKALKKRSAYTSRFKKVVYDELLEAELVAREARSDAVVAELRALRAITGKLRAAAAVAEENAAAAAAAATATPLTPAAAETPTMAELPLVGSPVSPVEPATEGAPVAVADPPTTAAAPSQPPLTWPGADKDGSGRWTLDASWADTPFPIWEATCDAAHAA